MVKKLHARQRQAGYSPKKLKSDLKRVRAVFDNVAASRDRFAIYKYWHAVYGLRRKWRRLQRNEGVKIRKIANRAFQGGIPANSGGDGPLRLIIDATMSTKVQNPTVRTRLSKLRSKYFSLLNYVYKQKVTTRNVEKFIEHHGGLNFKTSAAPKAKQRKRGRGK